MSNFASGGGISAPTGMVFNSSGDLYVAYQNAKSIGKITSNGTISTFVSSASFSNEGELAIDSSNNIYLANEANNTISKITPSGTVSIFASATTPMGLVFQTQTVPEPSTYALFGIGALVLIVAYRRKVA